MKSKKVEWELKRIFYDTSAFRTTLNVFEALDTKVFFLRFCFAKVFRVLREGVKSHLVKHSQSSRIQMESTFFFTFPNSLSQSSNTINQNSTRFCVFYKVKFFSFFSLLKITVEIQTLHPNPISFKIVSSKKNDVNTKFM